MLLLMEAYTRTVTELSRIGGGKLIASYLIDDSGRIRREVNEFIRKEQEQDDEMIAALMAYWMNK